MERGKVIYSAFKQIFSFKLFLLYLSLCSLILIRSYFDLDGCLSPDSTNYLSLTKNLLAGEGFRIADFSSPDGKSFFAIWPVGYPILIFIIAKLTGLGVFWASKVLSLLAIGIILLLFRFLFKENAHWAGLIFFIDSFILIFSYTWSEGLFILFLLFTCFSLFKCVETNGRILWLAALFLSGISVFMMRYIGLFSVGLIGLISLIHLYNRRWALSIKLIIISLLQLLFAGVYLYHNKIATGFITGMHRDPPEESNLVLLKQLASALKDEFIVIKSGIPLTLSFGLLLLLGIYLFRTRGKRHFNEKFGDLWKHFLLAGILYYAAIIGAKWISNFTPLDYRYLFPGSFCIILSLALYLQGKPRIKILSSTLLYLAILITLTIHYLPHTDYFYKKVHAGTNYFQITNYFDNTKKILEEYKGVEPKSVVVFGSIHLRYLREDVIPSDIYNLSSIEEMINYFSQAQDWNVYIKIRDDLNPDKIHESYIRFMESNKDKQIVKVH